MRSRTIVAIVLVAIAGALTGWRYWQNEDSVDYRPSPALTDEDRAQFQHINRILVSAMSADEQAANRAHLESVRAFARNSAADHGKLLNTFTGIVHRIDPDFTFTAVSSHDPFGPGEGISYDLSYLQDTLSRHAEFRDTIATLQTGQNRQLMRFASQWEKVAATHEATAETLLMKLPDVGSNISLLLIAGAMALTAATAINTSRRKR